MDNEQSERKMYSGKWNCSKCGSEITQLPFEPNENRLGELLCRNCYKPKANFRRY